MSSDVHNDYNRLLSEAGIYKQQLDMIQNELEKATKTLSEISNAKTTLKETTDEEEMIVPIGGGVFLKETASVKKIILRVGSAYSLALSRTEATDELEKREKSIRTLIEKFNKEGMQLAEHINKINLELSKYQQQGQQVR